LADSFFSATPWQSRWDQARADDQASLADPANQADPFRADVLRRAVAAREAQRNAQVGTFNQGLEGINQARQAGEQQIQGLESERTKTADETRAHSAALAKQAQDEAAQLEGQYKSKLDAIDAQIAKGPVNGAGQYNNLKTQRQTLVNELASKQKELQGRVNDWSSSDSTQLRSNDQRLDSKRATTQQQTNSQLRSLAQKASGQLTAQQQADEAANQEAAKNTYAAVPGINQSGFMGGQPTGFAPQSPVAQAPAVQANPAQVSLAVGQGWQAGQNQSQGPQAQQLQFFQPGAAPVYQPPPPPPPPPPAAPPAPAPAQAPKPNMTPQPQPQQPPGVARMTTVNAPKPGVNYEGGKQVTVNQTKPGNQGGGNSTSYESNLISRQPGQNNSSNYVSNMINQIQQQRSFYGGGGHY
jgi:hypothetical protein